MSFDVSTMSVTEAAESRHSIRRFVQQPIPEGDLREMLRITSLAPSAFNVQPWRFVVVRDPELKAQLADAAYGQAQVRSAPAVIVLYSDMQDVLENADEIVHPGVDGERRAQTVASLRNTWGAKSDAERESFGAGQSYIALGYLLLAARSLGYDTSPMLGFDAARVKTLLGLPAHAALPAIVAVGLADEEGFSHHRHEVDRITDWR